MPDEPPVVGLASEVVAEPEKSPLIPLTIVWQADERPRGRFQVGLPPLLQEIFGRLTKVPATGRPVGVTSDSSPRP